MLGNYAQVDLIMGGAPVADSVAVAMAVTSTLDVQGPGVAQDDAVQLVSTWAWIRERIMRGAADHVKAALYKIDKQSGKLVFVDVYEGSEKTLYDRALKYGLEAKLVVGDGPMVAPYPGGAGLPNDYAIKLARALDNTTKKIADSKVGGAVPAGFSDMTQAVVAPVIVALIVGGVALTVIGSVAAWRYLDPDVRKNTAILHAASRAYEARIQAAKESGKLPDPSPLEVNALPTIEAASKQETNRTLLVGLGIAGGLTGAAVGVALLRSA